MKTWSDDHPKAGLMARKRAAILAAAEAEFLRGGYKGSSMEGIAAAAGVSIMTLYRHAESKDDLFGAVIAQACSPDARDADYQARYAATLRAPLREALLTIGAIIQDRLASPDTVALLRTVISESGQSPALGSLAYHGLIDAHADKLSGFLADRAESSGMDTAERDRLCGAFVERLAGFDPLRLLLGLDTVSEAERQDRAARAADEMIEGLEAKA